MTLFRRRPFALTPAGEELWAFIRPFFSGLDGMTERLRGKVDHQIRIGASEVIQRDHLPQIVQNVRRRFPNFKLHLREAYHPELENLLQRQELDLAITLLESKPPAGVNTAELIRLSLALLVPKQSKITSAEQLWSEDRIKEPLVALPAAEWVCRHFQQVLGKRGIEWYTSLEVTSLALVESYVINGFGIGLTLNVPQTLGSKKVRLVPLDDFPPVVVAAMWAGKRSGLVDCFIKECIGRAGFLRGEAEPQLDSCKVDSVLTV